MFRAGAPSDGGDDGRHVDHLLAVENGIGIARQMPPGCHRLLEQGTRRCQCAATQIVERGFVRGDQSHFRAKLDGQVADRQSPLDGHVADRGTRILNRIAGAGPCADPPDQMQNQVFGRDSRPHRALKTHPHAARLALAQGLGGQRVHQFGLPHPERQRANTAVGAGMAVPADKRRAWQHDAQFRGHHMHDPLPVLAEIEEPYAGFCRTPPQPLHQPGARSKTVLRAAR